MLDQLLHTALLERDKLQQQVFSAAPKDWAEFQQRYGRWLQAMQQIQQIQQLMEIERTAP